MKLCPDFETATGIIMLYYVAINTLAQNNTVSNKARGQGSSKRYNSVVEIP